MGSIKREQIDILRKAAAALVEDCAEPCWGLAQGLSELAEQLVLGNADLRQTERGCAACGETADRHHAWCIHAHEEQSAVGPIYYELPDNFCSYPGPRQCSNCEHAGSNCGRLIEEYPFLEPVNELAPEGSADERRLEIEGYGQWLYEQGQISHEELHKGLDAFNEQGFRDIMSGMVWP